MSDVGVGALTGEEEVGGIGMDGEPEFGEGGNEEDDGPESS